MTFENLCDQFRIHYFRDWKHLIVQIEKVVENKLNWKKTTTPPALLNNLLVDINGLDNL